MKESINVPLLNIVAETVKQLPIVSQKVTLFSTSSTFESGIYQKGIINDGHEFIFKDEWQVKLNNLIQKIKVDKENIENIDIWNGIIEDVKKESIQSIVIAYTDLNVVLEKAHPQINIIDSSKCLAQSVISRYLKLVK